LIKEGLDKYSKKVAVAICGADNHNAWTIIGHGPIKQSPHRSSEQNISVIIAPMSDHQSVNIQESISVNLPIGGLDFYQRRRSWFKNEVSAEYYRSSKYYYDFRFDPTNYRIVALGDLYEFSDKLYNGHNTSIDELLSSKYLIFDSFISGGKKRQLYVPCTEILRFYYTSSSSFIKQVFSGKKATECLFNPQRDRTYKSLYYDFLTLRSTVCDVDAPFVGRVAFNDYSRKCFESIFTDTFINPDNPDHYPLCVPPLYEPTQWRVYGVSKGDSFFVTQIVSCSGSFPFEKILFGRDNDNRGNGNENADTLTLNIKSPPNYTTQKDDNSEDGPLLDDTPEPTVEVEPLLVEIEDEAPVFSALQGKDVDKIHKVTVKHKDKRTITVHQGSSAITKLATSDQSGSAHNSHIQKLIVERKDRNTLENAFISIYDIVPVINKKLTDSDTGSLELRFLNDEPHPIYPLASIFPYTENSPNNSLAFTNSHKQKEFKRLHSQKFLRPIVIFEIKYNDIYYYIIEFLHENGKSHDGKSMLIFSEASKEEATDQSIVAQIHLFGENQLSWKRNTVNSERSTAKFAYKCRHTIEGDAERKADLILNIIKSSQS
jgi:hypothetical protein